MYSCFNGSVTGFPVIVSHTLAVLSPDAVTIYFPSGLKTAELTVYSCFNGSLTGSPVFASHTLAVLSLDAVTIYFPSGLKTADITMSSCFNGSVTGLPVLAFHTLAVLSLDAVTIYFPSGLKTAEITPSSCCKMHWLYIPSIPGLSHFLNIISASLIYGLSGFSSSFGNASNDKRSALVMLPLSNSFSASLIR